MKTRTSIKAGSLRQVNHNESMKVRSAVKAGLRRRTIKANHNESMKVRSAVKSGRRFRSGKQNDGYGIKVMSVRTGVKAGAASWGTKPYK